MVEMYRCKGCGYFHVGPAPERCPVCGASQNMFVAYAGPGDLSGSETLENLKAAFAGESQANRRYTLFKRVAELEGAPGFGHLGVRSRRYRRDGARAWTPRLHGRRRQHRREPPCGCRGREVRVHRDVSRASPRRLRPRVSPISPTTSARWAVLRTSTARNTSTPSRSSNPKSDASEGLRARRPRHQGALASRDCRVLARPWRSALQDRPGRTVAVRARRHVVRRDDRPTRRPAGVARRPARAPRAHGRRTPGLPPRRHAQVPPATRRRRTRRDRGASDAPIALPCASRRRPAVRWAARSAPRGRRDSYATLHLGRWSTRSGSWPTTMASGSPTRSPWARASRSPTTTPSWGLCAS